MDKSWQNYTKKKTTFILTQLPRNISRQLAFILDTVTTDKFNQRSILLTFNCQLKIVVAINYTLEADHQQCIWSLYLMSFGNPFQPSYAQPRINQIKCRRKLFNINQALLVSLQAHTHTQCGCTFHQMYGYACISTCISIQISI